MAMIGLGDEDETDEIREFFESHTDTERRRLYMLFKAMMERGGSIQEANWSDNAPDGSRSSPGIARAAKSGK